MLKIEYTKDYFEALERQVSKQPIKCAECGVKDGARRINKKGELGKTRAIVRLALIVPSGPANRADNVAMFCTKCRKPGKEYRAPRRMKPSELPQLFEA